MLFSTSKPLPSAMAFSKVSSLALGDSNLLWLSSSMRLGLSFPMVAVRIFLALENENPFSLYLTSSL